jgi:hypothetical protein
MAFQKITDPVLLKLATDKFESMFNAERGFLEVDPFLSGYPSLNCGTVYFDRAAEVIFPSVLKQICPMSVDLLIYVVDDDVPQFLVSDEVSPAIFEIIANKFPYYDTYLYSLQSMASVCIETIEKFVIYNDIADNILALVNSIPDDIIEGIELDVSNAAVSEPIWLKFPTPLLLPELR